MSALACGSLDDRAMSVGDFGSMSASVSIGDGDQLNTLIFAITGPNSYANTITVDTTSTLNTQRRIDGLLAGDYHVAATGTTVQGHGCVGERDFSINLHQLTQVVVHMACTFPHTTGSASLGAEVNICAGIDTLRVTPNADGTQIALVATASDPDNGPSPLGYTWNVQGTTLTGSSVTFPCPAAGAFAATLAVSDGDATCPVSVTAGTMESATFTCAGPA
jgi:hypothetical protein